MKLFIQYYRSKFIDNLISLRDLNNIDIVSQSVNKDIYKIHTQNNCTHYLFDDILIDNEILDFITNYHGTNKISIYHTNKFNIDLYKRIENLQITHLCHDKDINYPSIYIPTLYNPGLCNNTGDPGKKYHIISFLENIPEIPLELKQHLYPNKKIDIKLFNHVLFKHPQNMGTITELNKIELLNNTKYYLVINDKDYALEAKLCGAIPISLDEIESLSGESMQNISELNTSTYLNFLYDNIL